MPTAAAHCQRLQRREGRWTCLTRTETQGHPRKQQRHCCPMLRSPNMNQQCVGPRKLLAHHCCPMLRSPNINQQCVGPRKLLAHHFSLTPSMYICNPLPVTDTRKARSEALPTARGGVLSRCSSQIRRRTISRPCSRWGSHPPRKQPRTLCQCAVVRCHHHSGSRPASSSNSNSIIIIISSSSSSSSSSI